MKRFSVFFVCFLPLLMNAQGSAGGFFKLSRPEKCWVIRHPFVAKKAWKATQRTRELVDSLRSNNVLKDDNGGELDAFRHAFWMNQLSKKIGWKKALQLGEAHEKGNEIQFRKKLLEENLLPDSVSCLMDRMNNVIGVIKFLYAPDEKESDDVIDLIEALDVGYLVTIAKDSAGAYLGADGKKLDMDLWKGKWNIPKHLNVSQYVKYRQNYFTDKKSWKVLLNEIELISYGETGKKK